MTTGAFGSTGRIVYFSHGGGPLPILGEESHAAMNEFMRNLPDDHLSRPDTVLVVSAHWEEPAATVLGSPAPVMLYDYYGFPPEAYEITYPAPGSPQTADKIVTLLAQADIPVRTDTERGFDHGLFIPLSMMYPGADIPSLQLSLLRGLDPAAHIQMGKALQDLRNENILIIGSGFSFHNMRAFSWKGLTAADPENDAFQEWLIDVCCGNHSQKQREDFLIDWQKAPNARYCHPREEHLLPLHVCVGLAEKPAQLIFDDYILGKRAVAFKWE